MTTNLPGIFAAALAPFSPEGQAQLREAKLSAYRKALQSHDFEFEMSEDFSRYEAGRDCLAQLRLVQKEVDPLAEVWNSIAPPEHRILMDVVTAAGFGGCNV